jgi:hypothetical protein
MLLLLLDYPVFPFPFASSQDSVSPLRQQFAVAQSWRYAIVHLCPSGEV